jgi:glycosyltransferase involved in cell wall biosynthesis
MRVLHINTTSSGGAFRAMSRLHEGLLAAGVDSWHLTQDGLDGGADVLVGLGQRGPVAKRLLPKIDALPLRLYPKRAAGEFNLQWVPGGRGRLLDALKPDIVHLHWIGRGFVRIEDIRRIGRPAVWTMHDSWPFTGGCHVPYDCVRYRGGCGRCPKLGGSLPFDLSWWVWRRKAKAWRNLRLNLVSPSRWLAECAETSPLTKKFDIRIIPHGLDLDTLSPFNRQYARQALSLPSDKQLILFGAVSPLNDRNKGFHFLKPSLAEVIRNLDQHLIELIVLGSSAPAKPTEMGVPVRYMGVLNDKVSLRLLYAAADVTVLPSLTESFGQMASESLACGTPAVAFNATGFKDIIDHEMNGYLATPYEAEDLGRGIAFILTHCEKDRLRWNARDKAEKEFGVETMVERYLALYREAS